MDPSATANPQRTEIRIARFGALMRLIIFGVLVIAGSYMVAIDAHRVLGCAITLFSLWGAYFSFSLLVESNPGLVLDETNLAINAKVGYGGIVPWSQIEDISLVPYRHTRQLVVKVKNPADYLGRGNALFRFLNSLSSAQFGSPVRVNATMLDCDYDELVRTAARFRAAYGGA